VNSIAIIDDDPDVISALGSVLKAEGYEVIGESAMDRAVDFLVKAKPQLLILDVMFPEDEAGGFRIARQIRRTPELKGLPIIMLTNINQEYSVDLSGCDLDDQWMPAQAFQEKPVSTALLLENVRRLLKG
jgi:CheY-like chemotaxis protein